MYKGALARVSSKASRMSSVTNGKGPLRAQKAAWPETRSARKSCARAPSDNPSTGARLSPVLRDAGHHDPNPVPRRFAAAMDMPKRPIIVPMSHQIGDRARRVGIVPSRSIERSMHDPHVISSRRRRGIAGQRAFMDMWCVEAQAVEIDFSNRHRRPRPVKQVNILAERPVPLEIHQRVMVAADHDRWNTCARQPGQLYAKVGARG